MNYFNSNEHRTNGEKINEQNIIGLSLEGSISIKCLECTINNSVLLGKIKAKLAAPYKPSLNSFENDNITRRAKDSLT